MIGRLHVGILYYFETCYEIKSRFTVLGTLLTITPMVWARIEGWPAMVDDDPETGKD